MAEANELRKVQDWRPLANCPAILYHIPSGNYIELACHMCKANSNKHGDFFNGPMGLLQHLLDMHGVRAHYDLGETPADFLEMNCKVRDVDWEEAVQIEAGKATIQQYCPPSDSVPKPNMDLVLKYVEKRPLIVQFIKDGVIQSYIADDGSECTWRWLRCAVCECDGSNAKSFFNGIKGLREHLRRAHELAIPNGPATVEFMWHFSSYVPLTTEEVIKILDPEWTEPVKVYNKKKLNKEAKLKIQSYIENIQGRQQRLAEKYGFNEKKSEDEDAEGSEVEEPVTEFPTHNLVIRLREHKA